MLAAVVPPTSLHSVDAESPSLVYYSIDRNLGVLAADISSPAASSSSSSRAPLAVHDESAKDAARTANTAARCMIAARMVGRKAGRDTSPARIESTNDRLLV